MLEVKNISKYYGSKMAIENISFSASCGQIIGLVGHNGSGKTTTMSIITNCLAADGGTVSVDGVSLSDDPIKLRSKIGYLPEIPPVYTDMTVEEQLRFACGLKLLPHREYESQIAYVCEKLNIEGVRKRLIRNLSKGYRQRVGFAQALIGDPPLLILDEPTVGLDPQQIIELRELIASLRVKHTVILSSHILTEIAATCDRLVVLSSGHLAADSTLDELLRSAGEQKGILLQADAPADVLIRIVGTIDGVVNCRAETDASGNTAIRIYTKDGTDIHRELFNALAAADCPIRALKQEDVSIEDVFLQLTHDNRYSSIGGMNE